MASPGPPNSGPLPSSFDEDDEFFHEHTLSKIWRRCKQEPLVPLGCAVTVWALTGATRSMRKGDHKLTNLYFRRRLYAQAFTIVALVSGNIYWLADRKKRKEHKKMVAEKEHRDKRDRWLRELEARDDEEKAWQAKMGRNIRSAAEEVREDARGVTDMVAAKTRELKEQASRK